MLVFAQTLLLFLLTIVIAFAAGYGVTGLLLPREHREYRYVMTPVVGYPSVVLLAHFISGTFIMSVLVSSLIAFGLLFCISVYVFFSADRSTGAFYMVRQAGSAALVSLPMVVVTLWPMFVIGAQTYLASVNPDFFLGLADNEWLKHHPTNLIKAASQLDAYDIFAQLSGTISPSARYRGAYFAILLEGLFHIPQRTGLTLVIALFHYCMPASLYYMVRVAFGQGKNVAYLSAALLGISSSIGLGYLSYYIGQASVLGFLPALLTLWFCCLTKPAWRTFLLASVLTSALWVMYLGLLPYVGGPILGLAGYLLVTRQLRLRTLLAIACGAGGFLLAIHVRMMGALIGSIKAWALLAGTSTFLSQYYIDFVTERFFPMFYGLTIYTLETSVLHGALGAVRHVNWLYSLSVCITIGVVASFLSWLRSVKDRRSRAFGLACAVVYSGVALYYIFVRPYGYGSFKNSTWLQFMLVFVAAFGIARACRVAFGSHSFWKRSAAGLVLCVMALPFVAGNLLSSLQYGVKSLGRDTQNGYIVVLHNMSGNEDYFQLGDALRKIVRPDESVGLAFINVAQNGWAGYYLQGIRQSYLGQYLLPGDDENLPDVVSRRVVDAYGNVSIDSPTFFHGARDDYYLVNRQGVVNSDIVRRSIERVVWQDSTFMLLRSSETPDFMYPGRGFYRAEYRTARDQYMPQAMRWTAEGGELYVLRASDPGRPYRLALTGFAGYGVNSAKRTIEFYHNKKPFGEPKVIDGFGRIISDPFYPAGGVDFLVFKIKEKARAPARLFGLWHKDLPTEYRRLNLAVSDIELITPKPAMRSFQINEEIKGAALFTGSVAFNGIEPNWWVRKEMSISFSRPGGACAVGISIFVPGHASFRFPFALTLTVDGVSEQRHVAGPGQAWLTMPLSRNTDSGIATIQLKPRQFFAPDGFGNSERPVVQSVRLGGVSFLGCSAKRL
jgi:hypothetical protein